jgi:hypothetical protein
MSCEFFFVMAIPPMPCAVDAHSVIRIAGSARVADLSITVSNIGRNANAKENMPLPRKNYEDLLE